MQFVQYYTIIFFYISTYLWIYKEIQNNVTTSTAKQVVQKQKHEPPSWHHWCRISTERSCCCLLERAPEDGCGQFIQASKMPPRHRSLVTLRCQATLFVLANKCFSFLFNKQPSKITQCNATEPYCYEL